jgi:hypothetical protein
MEPTGPSIDEEIKDELLVAGSLADSQLLKTGPEFYKFYKKNYNNGFFEQIEGQIEDAKNKAKIYIDLINKYNLFFSNNPKYEVRPPQPGWRSHGRRSNPEGTFLSPSDKFDFIQQEIEKMEKEYKMKIELMNRLSEDYRSCVFKGDETY